MATKFENKTAIVTGGASGIGRAIATELQRLGADVLIADIVGATEAAKAIGCRGVTLDVTDADAVNTVVREFSEERGRLDYIFNNAGIVVAGEAKVLEYVDWKRTIDVNVYGVINGVHAAYPLMVRQGFGHIVNTASAAGLVPTPESVPYGASKFAVVGLSRSLRAEGKAHGVKVTAICPGFVRTPIIDTAKLIGISKEKSIALIDKLGWMEPDDLAREVIKGVRENRALIIAPRSAQVIVWAARMFPDLADWVTAELVERLRAQL